MEFKALSAIQNMLLPSPLMQFGHVTTEKCHMTCPETKYQSQKNYLHQPTKCTSYPL